MTKRQKMIPIKTERPGWYILGHPGALCPLRNPGRGTMLRADKSAAGTAARDVRIKIKRQKRRITMIPKTLSKLGLKTALGYIEKDPERNLPKLMEWVDKLAGTGPDSFQEQRDAFRRVITDPDNNMYQLIMSIFRDVDNEVLKATFENFFLNANIIGWPIQEKYRAEYGCNIPWAILLDPTSACNLRCTGCWAAEYGNRLNLSLEEIDAIIQQGKALGVYMYIYTGGEPLVRKSDLMTLCRRHSDCQFLAFTNATLIDEAFAGEMLRVKNLIPAISLDIRTTPARPVRAPLKVNIIRFFLFTLIPDAMAVFSLPPMA